MRSGRQLALQVLQERYAEQKMVKLLQGSSHTHCMELLERRLLDKIGNVSLTSCSIVDDKGKKITLLPREFDDRIIKAYSEQLPEPPDLGLLSNNTVSLALDCARWLRDGGGWSKSRRYSHAQDSDARIFIKWNMFIDFGWYQMVHKYETHNMVDHWAESEMGKLIALRNFCREINKAFHHSGEKDPELIKEVYAHAQALISDRQYPPFDHVSLPPGIPDPLELPEGDSEEEGGRTVA